MSLTSNSRRDVLLALQARLSAALDEAEPGHVASLARELRAVVAEVEALGGTGTPDRLDEVAAARAARRQQASQGGTS